MVGITLSHYRIVGELGRGGMGIVYLAEDTKLDRQVAVKVLPPSALASEDDRARFYREAKAAAALNHPNIAQIYQIDEAVPSDAPHGTQPSPFIVMEYINGEPLDARIRKGPLKVKEAVQLATQIASALGEAHEKGIVHRDIKASNVMLTDDGHAKVLDFGLALTTASTKLTRMGSTLGTVAYMSPEQARGEEVDRRTDLWSLGVTLYEMVTGQHPFPGDYEQARVYSLLNVDPEPLSSLRSRVPLELERIVTKLMAKDRELRYQTAEDLKADFKALQMDGSGVGVSSSVSAGKPPSNGQVLDVRHRISRGSVWAVVLLGVIVSALAGYWVGLANSDDASPIIRTTLDVTEGPDPPVALAVSPKTTFLAFSDLNEVHVRELSSGNTWDYASSGEVLRLWFSRDEQWLFMERPGAILRAPSRGGTVTELVQVEASFPFGLLTPDNELVYESGGRILKYPLGARESVDAIEMDSSIFYNDPAITPDGRRLLVNDAGLSRFFDSRTGKPGQQMSDLATFPTFLTESLILGGDEEGVLLWPVDIEAERFTDAPFTLTTTSMPRAFSVSDDGHLFYADQVVDLTGGFQLQAFRRVTPDGVETEYPPQQGLYGEFDVAPSGVMATVDLLQDAAGIRISNLLTGVSTDILIGWNAWDPILVARGDSVVTVVNTSEGDAEIFVAASDGSGEPRMAGRISNRLVRHPSVMPGERSIVLEAKTTTSQGGADIWTMNLDTGNASSLHGGTGNQTHPAISPDGAWLTFESDAERNQSAILIRSADEGDRRPPVTVASGQRPRWSPDDNQLYFLENGRVLRADFRGYVQGGELPVPELLIKPIGRIRSYDVLPGGEGVVVTYSLVPQRMEGRQVDGLVHVIYNWASTLDAPATLNN